MPINTKLGERGEKPNQMKLSTKSDYVTKLNCISFFSPTTTPFLFFPHQNTTTYFLFFFFLFLGQILNNEETLAEHLTKSATNQRGDDGVTPIARFLEPIPVSDRCAVGIYGRWSIINRWKDEKLTFFFSPRNVNWKKPTEKSQMMKCCQELSGFLWYWSGLLGQGCAFLQLNTSVCSSLLLPAQFPYRTNYRCIIFCFQAT